MSRLFPSFSTIFNRSFCDFVTSVTNFAGFCGYFALSCFFVFMEPKNGYPQPHSSSTWGMIGRLF